MIIAPPPQAPAPCDFPRVGGDRESARPEDLDMAVPGDVSRSADEVLRELSYASFDYSI